MTRLKKHLGQHLLNSPAILDRIVATAEVAPRDLVLEIGAGPGNLTRRLADAVTGGGRVAAVELDRSWLEPLEALARERPWVDVLWGDALALDLSATLTSAPREGDARPWKCVANIPYYITAPLIERLIDLRHHFSRIALLVQREVAVRVAAERGREVGSQSHFVRYYCIPRVAFDVPAEAFTPPPDVDSALLVLDVRDVPAVDAPPDVLFRVIHTAFGGRRKMLRKSLRGLPGGGEPCFVEIMLERAGVDGERRPEELALEEFGALALAYEAASGRALTE